MHVSFTNAEESPVSQQSQHPTLHILNTVFCAGFILLFRIRNKRDYPDVLQIPN